MVGLELLVENTERSAAFAQIASERVVPERIDAEVDTDAEVGTDAEAGTDAEVDTDAGTEADTGIDAGADAEGDAECDAGLNTRQAPCFLCR